MELDEIDPIGLIRDSYLIDGIDASECRSIFLGWAIKLPEEYENSAAIDVLLGVYGAAHPDHPMSEILRQGQLDVQLSGRRGGRRSRVKASGEQN